MKPAIIALICVLSFFALFFLIYLFLIKPGKRRAEIDKFKSVKYAHRGLHGGGVAENSISAFRAAKDAGFGIELDVRLSADGELVVYHDDTLLRVSGIDARVDEKTAAELSEIHLSETADTVPTFKEVLELVDGRVPLLVEIKEDAGKYGVTEKTAELLREYKGDFIVESFNPLALGRFKTLMPEVMRGILSQNFLSEKKYRTVTHFLLEILALNVICRPDFIAFNHKHSKNAALRLARSLFGAPTLAWTVRSQSEEDIAGKHGFDGIIFENYIPKR